MASQQSKKERRGEVRAAARAEQQRRLRQEKRRKVIGRALLIGVPLLVIALIVAVVVTRPDTSKGPAPQAVNQQGGVVLTSSTEVADGDLKEVDLSTLPQNQSQEQGSAPPGVAAAAEGEPAQVVIYADANCVHCAEFDQTHRTLLRTALDNGEITLEYRFVNYLDQSSANNYSTRAANAIACVAERDPEAYLPFIESVYDSYGSEPDSDELAAKAKELGVDIGGCLDDNTYRTFVNYTSDLGLAHGVRGTPSVWVQGESWKDSGQDFTTFLAGAVSN